MLKRTYPEVSILRLIINLVLLLLVLYNEYENHYTQVLYSALVYMPFYLIIFIIYCIFLIFDIVVLIESKKTLSLLPSFVGLVLILASLSLFKFHRYKIYQKSSFKVLSVSENNDEEELEYEIDFKKNGNYVVFESEESGLFTNYYYGTYSKKDSIVRLDKQIGKKKISNILLIRKVKNQVNKSQLKQLIQIDIHGKEILNGFKFRFKKHRK